MHYVSFSDAVGSFKQNLLRLYKSVKNSIKNSVIFNLSNKLEDR